MGYFKYVPDFNYVDRTADAKIGSYTKMKNFFRRVKLSDEVFQTATLFEKYQIQGDDRPDNVAHAYYNNAELDWLVLISNNIVNVQTEWPMPQLVFDSFLINKYGTYDELNSVHHYETIEVKNSKGMTIVEQGLQVKQGMTYTYYEEDQDTFVTTGDATLPVTNYQYETELEESKRNISLIRAKYLPVILDEIEKLMEYKKGSSDYISGTLKSSSNIRLTN